MPLPVRGVPSTLLLLPLHTCPCKVMVSFCGENHTCDGFILW